MSDASFRRQLESEFDGDYRLEWHAAPPHLPVLDWLLRRRDPDTGRTRKIAFGGWIFPVLGLLARLKRLRGSAFDPFGRTAHRRLERQLIADYEHTLEELVEALSSGNRDLAVEIASLPEQIRGYESVKEHSLEGVRRRQEELLDAFRAGRG